MNRNRLHRGSNNKKTIIVIVAIACLSIIVMSAMSPFAHIQVAAQQQENSNNNNNTPKLSLPTISTTVGTGAAATGVILTVPGFLKTRKQSKCLSTYLLKIQDKYDEFCKKTKAVDTKKYPDFLEELRTEIIYLWQRREINENQYKMLDDRIVEYLNKITQLK
jgi:hypothetical protein